jgi:hypothetical protein
MALHPVKLPKSARDLFRIVLMQRLLLKSLCADPLDADKLDEAWLLGVWKKLDPAWIKRFCRKRKFSILEPIKTIAKSSLVARQSLYKEFCSQYRTEKLFNSGGHFWKLDSLPHITPQLASEVHRLFIRFYQFLSHDTNTGWKGYEFADRCISNRSYKAALDESNRPSVSVCPYCDGANDEPELDHYYAKETFPLLSCSPWNLVPACHLCNKLNAKGSRLALSPESAQPTADWLHPFFRSASAQVQIQLNGNPRNSIPNLYSPDPNEQARLNHHHDLIRNLAKRWTRVASNYFDILVRQVNQRLNAKNSVDSLIEIKLQEHLESRGQAPSSMIQAAVCQAVLDRRSGYIEEFSTPNAPTLE